MKKKLLLIGSIIIVVGGIIVGVYYKPIKKTIIKKPVTTNIVLKDTSNEKVLYGTFINPKDYVENIENGKLENNQKVLIDSFPKATIEIKYYDNNDELNIKEIELNVIDDEKPQIMNAGNITIKPGEDPDFKHHVMIGDNADRNPKIEIIGNYDVNRIGTYSLKYLVTDASGNQSEQWFKLNVVNNTSTSNQNYTHNNYYFSSFINDYKTDDVMLGIDVSKWQGDINWSKVKEAGCEFAIIRVGYQYGKDGELKVDPYFEKNIKGANEAGIPVGIYFYTYAYTTDQAKEHAKWVVNQIKKYKVDLPIAFDWENWTSFSTYGINFLDINQIAQTYIDTINENGYKGMMYSSKSYLEAIWNDFDPLWLAHYTKQTNYTGDYLFWQVSNIGKINGINADVDLDIYYKEKSKN